jgi:phage-related protein
MAIPLNAIMNFLDTVSPALNGIIDSLRDILEIITRVHNILKAIRDIVNIIKDIRDTF